VDEVFRAINDPNRRYLLDMFAERDGQTLGELCAHLPQMTRFGVMNHLGILEGAGLVTTLKRGRSKYHYLNPVPIRQIHDRWISKYAEMKVGAIAVLKYRLENGERQLDDKPAHVYKTYIRGTAEDVWDAIVNPDKTEQYFFGTRVKSVWEVGSALEYYYPDGTLVADGQVLAIDAPKRLEHTFRALWDEDLKAEGPMREVLTLTEHEGMVELTVEMYDLDPSSKRFTDFTQGNPYIYAGLKSLVETGEPLPALGQG
jgi:uncharacterized protein YndB with AHSA1/START domain/DNA-binding transcriptional ArsR family regulator